MLSLLSLPLLHTEVNYKAPLPSTNTHRLCHSHPLKMTMYTNHVTEMVKMQHHTSFSGIIYYFSHSIISKELFGNCPWTADHSRAACLPQKLSCLPSVLWAGLGWRLKQAVRQCHPASHRTRAKQIQLEGSGMSKQKQTKKMALF